MEDKVIMKKVAGVGNEMYQASLSMSSKFLYELSICELKSSTEKVEVVEKEKYISRQTKIRPYNDGTLGASEVAKRQHQIDTFLSAHSVDEALIEVVPEGQKEKVRPIEHALKFKCERWIDETSAVRDVPVSKDQTTVKEKHLKTIPFYFRPSGGMISKTIQNFIKHKNL